MCPAVQVKVFASCRLWTLNLRVEVKTVKIEQGFLPRVLGVYLNFIFTFFYRNTFSHTHPNLEVKVIVPSLITSDRNIYCQGFDQ